MNRTKLTSTVKLFMVYIVTGVVCGFVGTVFSKGVSFVTNIRGENEWILFLLPLAGIASVAIYRLLKVAHMGTNEVIESTGNKTVLSSKLAPAVFCASLLSHLCGASVGREGAALQLGGSSAIFLSKRFKLTKEEEKTLIYCGMAGVFSSVFGTPFAAAVFALEVVFVGHVYFRAIAPAFITSQISYYTAVLLGAHAERFALTEIPTVNFSVIWKTLVISVFAAAIGVIFCLSLRHAEKLLERLFKNPYLRIAIGGSVIVLFTMLIGSYDYNGAGVQVIERIFNDNEFVPLSFAFKILFTCLAVGAGFKGGEIVPTLFIGATFGALAGTWLGLPVAFSAALCMAALFCSVTNCPFASILLAAELFSGKGIVYISIAVIISYLLSGRISLYTAQKTDGFKNRF